MNPPTNDLPPLKNIEKSGTYVMKLIKPKDDKMLERFKVNKRGFASCRLFFVDGDGNCMTKNYSVEFGKGLAMLVGKMTGTFSPEPPTSMTVDNLIRYVSPAFGRKASIEIEATPDIRHDKVLEATQRLAAGGVGSREIADMIVAHAIAEALG